jgi:RHS repeat-associated protein
VREAKNDAGVFRYGFNGKENDSEIKGEGNQQDYGLRIYDPRLGRFLSVDPLTKWYPMLTPYQFASNRPVDGVDLDGAEYKNKSAYKAISTPAPVLRLVNNKMVIQDMDVLGGKNSI